MEESVIELEIYLNDEKYEKIKRQSNEYKNYLLTFNDYHFNHGDLWYENYIIDDNNNLIGIVDFENSGKGDSANDIYGLNYLGKDFMDKVLYYYKYTNDEMIRRISLLIKATEICYFKNVIDNYPDEINDQLNKIKKVIG